MIHRRSALLLAAIGATLALWLGNLAADTIESPTTTIACAEDDACWNCETMGNLTCGPDHGTVAP